MLVPSAFAGVVVSQIAKHGWPVNQRLAIAADWARRVQLVN